MVSLAFLVGHPLRQGRTSPARAAGSDSRHVEEGIEALNPSPPMGYIHLKPTLDAVNLNSLMTKLLQPAEADLIASSAKLVTSILGS